MFFSDSHRPTFRCAKRTVQSDGSFVSKIPKALMCMEEALVMHELEQERAQEGFRKSFSGYRPTHTLEEWAAIVRQYSRRAVTFSADRLPAIMGIVAVWGNRLRWSLGSYRAGLWSERFLCDLLWRAARTVTPRAAHASFIAPSWSWASRAHQVAYVHESDMFSKDTLARVLACDVTPASLEVPNGALKSARLTIECVAQEVEVPNPEDDSADSHWKELPTRDGTVEFHFDDSPRPPGIERMWLLSVAYVEPYNYPHPTGLGVIEVENDDGTYAKLYKRVGMFDYTTGKSMGDEGETIGMLRFTIV